jgi:hypothetical protein
MSNSVSFHIRTSPLLATNLSITPPEAAVITRFRNKNLTASLPRMIGAQFRNTFQKCATTGRKPREHNHLHVKFKKQSKVIAAWKAMTLDLGKSLGPSLKCSVITWRTITLNRHQTLTRPTQTTARTMIRLLKRKNHQGALVCRSTGHGDRLHEMSTAVVLESVAIDVVFIVLLYLSSRGTIED